MSLFELLVTNKEIEGLGVKLWLGRERALKLPGSYEVLKIRSMLELEWCNHWYPPYRKRAKKLLDNFDVYVNVRMKGYDRVTAQEIVFSGSLMEK